MKKFILFLMFMFITSVSSAQQGSFFNPMTGQFDGCLNVAEIDGSPSNMICGKLKVSNGALTNNGDGTFTLTTGVGGGGDVSGPSGVTDNAVTRFDGTGGKTIQDSSIYLDDSGGWSSYSGLFDFDDDDLLTTGSGTFANITIGTSSITASSGTIDFGNESLVTTGASSFGNVTAPTYYGDGSNLTGISSGWIGTATSNLDMDNFDINNVGGITADVGTVDILNVALGDIRMDVNTAGNFIVANGTSFKSTAMSGDITINSSGVTAIGADKIKDTMVDWGTGAGQVSAVDMPIADASAYYDGADVEIALTEVVTRGEWRQNGFNYHPGIDYSWNDGTLTLTISPTSGSYDYYILGERYTESGNLTETITDTTGNWVIYFDSEGDLVSVNNPSHTQIDDVILTKCIVAYVYWNDVTNDGRLMVETHGFNMSPSTHEWIHDNIGSVYKSGMALADFDDVDGDGDQDRDVHFSVAAGEFYDEDVEHEPVAIAVGGNMELWYLVGTDWTWTTVTEPGLTTGTGRLAYNSSGSQAEVNNNDFALVHVFGTNMYDDTATNAKYIFIQGQDQYTNLSNARAGADTEINTLSFGTLPLEEIVPVATIILQSGDGRVNSIKSEIKSTDAGDNYVDWRSANLKASGGSISDHGALAGLADDDHPQYVLNDGEATDITNGTFDLTTTGALEASIGTMDINGTASDATVLETARTIAGVSFNGSANINIPSTGLSDTADLLYEAELDNITKLNTQVSETVLISGGTLVNTKYCTADGTSGAIDCNSEGGSGGGDFMADGSVVMTGSTTFSLDDIGGVYGASQDASIYFDDVEQDLYLDVSANADAYIVANGTFQVKGTAGADSIVSGSLQVNGTGEASIVLDGTGEASIYFDDQDGSIYYDLTEPGLYLDSVTSVVSNSTFEVRGIGNTIEFSTGETSDPCGSLNNGTMFYNETSNYFCYCNGSNDVKMSDDSTACF